MRQDYLSTTTGGIQLPSSVNLTTGAKSLGYITFDVPKGDSVCGGPGHVPVAHVVELVGGAAAREPKPHPIRNGADHRRG